MKSGSILPLSVELATEEQLHFGFVCSSTATLNPCSRGSSKILLIIMV